MSQYLRLSGSPQFQGAVAAADTGGQVDMASVTRPERLRDKRAAVALRQPSALELVRRVKEQIKLLEGMPG